MREFNEKSIYNHQDIDVRHTKTFPKWNFYLITYHEIIKGSAHGFRSDCSSIYDCNKGCQETCHQKNFTETVGR